MKRGVSVLGLVLVLAACGGSGGGSESGEAPPAASAQQEGTGPAASLAPGAHVWVAADGAEVPYEVAGAGDVTVVLVHCWGCDRTFWSAQVPVLAERYRVVTLDLPGHGEAGRARERWTVAGYGEDVAGLIRDLDLRDVVLVGHSMGGPVALRAAALAGGRVRGIVAVDTLHDAEFDFSGERMEQLMQAFESDFAGTCSEFVAEMLPEEGVEAIAEKIRSTGCDPQQAAVGTALMRDFGTIEMETWLAEAGVPIRAINAAEPNETKVDTNRKYADFDVALMEEVGHYPQMTRPERFNPLLLAAIEEILAETA